MGLCKSTIVTAMPVLMSCRYVVHHQGFAIHCCGYALKGVSRPCAIGWTAKEQQKAWMRGVRMFALRESSGIAGAKMPVLGKAHVVLSSGVCGRLKSFMRPPSKFSSTGPILVDLWPPSHVIHELRTLLGLGILLIQAAMFLVPPKDLGG